jgi:hypothetical protein
MELSGIVAVASSDTNVDDECSWQAGGSCVALSGTD